MDHSMPSKWLSLSGAAVAPRVTTRMFETAPASSSPPQPADTSPEPGAVPTATTPTTSTVAEQTVDIHAPADMIPPASLRERLAWYAGAIVLTCLLVFFGLASRPSQPPRAVLLRPRRAPHPPDGQGHRRARTGRALAERTHGRGVTADRPPDIMELHDFPVIDFLHFTLIWLLSKFVSASRRTLQPVLPPHLSADDAHGDDRLSAPGADAPGGGRRRVALLLPPVPLPALGEPLLPRRVLDGAALALAGVRDLPRATSRSSAAPRLERIERTSGAGRSARTRRPLRRRSPRRAPTTRSSPARSPRSPGLYAWAGLPDVARRSRSAGAIVAVIVVVGLIHHLPTLPSTSGSTAKNPITDRHAGRSRYLRDEDRAPRPARSPTTT